MKSDNLANGRVLRDWRFLCRHLGERRAGSRAEAEAARYIAGQLQSAGLQVRTEAFPCTSLISADVVVAGRFRSEWRKAAAQTLVGAPGTPGHRFVEGPVAWLEMPEGAHRLRRGSLKGRIALLFGPLPTEVKHHRALVAAQPLAVIHIDERLPFTWCKSDGVYPLWAARYGMPPTVAIPYVDAWRWRLERVDRVRVRVAVDQARRNSQNVIAESPGRDPRLPGILICGHHDTQCDNPGADDNASGVMCVLEMARALGRRQHRRSLRFISFGTEEQLSVGSAAYVRAHRDELRDIGLVVNFDSVASPLGHFQLSCIGDDALARTATQALARQGVDVVTSREVTPFVDNFPFNWAGIPSLWFFRANFPGGRWQHHSPHDTLANVSVDVLLRLLGAAMPVVERWAKAKAWPFSTRLPRPVRREARRLGRELFDLR